MCNSQCLKIVQLDKPGQRARLEELYRQAQDDSGLCAELQCELWHLAGKLCLPVAGMAVHLLKSGMMFDDIIPELTTGRISGRIFPEIQEWLEDQADPAAQSDRTIELMAV